MFSPLQALNDKTNLPSTPSTLHDEKSSFKSDFCSFNDIHHNVYERVVSWL